MLNPEQTQLIPIDQITNPPNHNRKLDDNHVADLAADIKRHGLRHPITVIASGKRIEVIAGLHRLEACRILGLNDIECKMLDPSTSKAELLEISIAENQVRKNESLSETFARIDQIIKERQCSIKEAAQRAGVTKSKASMLRVYDDKMCADGKQLVDKHPHDIGISIAYEVARHARSDAQQIEWLESFIDGSMTRDDITRSMNSKAAKKVRLNLKLEEVDLKVSYPEAMPFETLIAVLTTLKARILAEQKRGIHMIDLPKYLHTSTKETCHVS